MTIDQNHRQVNEKEAPEGSHSQEMLRIIQILLSFGMTRAHKINLVYFKNPEEL